MDAEPCPPIAECGGDCGVGERGQLTVACGVAPLSCSSGNSTLSPGGRLLLSSAPSEEKRQQRPWLGEGPRYPALRAKGMQLQVRRAPKRAWEGKWPLLWS